VREGEEALVAQPVDHRLGDLVRLQPLRDGVRRVQPDAGLARQRQAVLEQLRAHGHRADAAHLDAAIAVGEREPLGERHRGVLRGLDESRQIVRIRHVTPQPNRHGTI